jgi:hypothetical protein
MHGKVSRCATVTEMRLHGRRLCMKRTGGAWPEARAVLKVKVVNCCYRRVRGGREGVGTVWWIADIPALSTAAGLTDTSHSNGRTPRLLARFTYRPWACTPACVLIVAGSAFWGLAQQSVPHLTLGHPGLVGQTSCQPASRTPSAAGYAVPSLRHIIATMGQLPCCP